MAGALIRKVCPHEITALQMATGSDGPPSLVRTSIAELLAESSSPKALQEQLDRITALLNSSIAEKDQLMETNRILARQNQDLIAGMGAIQDLEAKLSIVNARYEEARKKSEAFNETLQRYESAFKEAVRKYEELKQAAGLGEIGRGSNEHTHTTAGV